MPRSEPPMRDDGAVSESIIPIDSPKGDIIGDHVTPPALIDSWDPADDETAAEQHRPAQWDWHGYPSWGRRAVTAYPVLALMLAIASHRRRHHLGPGGHRPSPVGHRHRGRHPPVGRTPGGPRRPRARKRWAGRLSGRHLPSPGSGRPNHRGEHLTGLAQLPGMGGQRQRRTDQRSGRGRRRVAPRRCAPPDLGLPGLVPDGDVGHPGVVCLPILGRLTATGSRHRPSGRGRTGHGRADQPDDRHRGHQLRPGRRKRLSRRSTRLDRGLLAGTPGAMPSSTSYEQVPWSAGPLHVAIQTNGNNRLDVWVNGRPFYSADDLHMGITPPFEPYLEVQARRTAYTVAFDGYSSVCQNDVAHLRRSRRKHRSAGGPHRHRPRRFRGTSPGHGHGADHR